MVKFNLHYSIAFILFSVIFSDVKIGDPASTFFLRTLAEENFFMSDTLEQNKYYMSKRDIFY